MLSQRAGTLLSYTVYIMFLYNEFRKLQIYITVV